MEEPKLYIVPLACLKIQTQPADGLEHVRERGERKICEEDRTIPDQVVLLSTYAA